MAHAAADAGVARRRAAATTRSSSTSRSTTASARSSRCRRAARRPSVVAPRQREDRASSPRSPRRSTLGAAAASAASCSTAKSSRSTPKGDPPASSSCRGASTCPRSTTRPAAAASRSSCSTSCATARRSARPAAARAPRRARTRCSANDRIADAAHQRKVRGDGRALYDRALEQRLGRADREARRLAYKSGKRTPDWRKLKIVHEQEFVVGGWTEPRQTRTYFGALLLGVYPSRAAHAAVLVYAGTPAPASTSASWRALMKLLQAARDAGRVRSRRSRRPTSGRTGSSPSWSRRSSSPSGPPTASCGIPCISVCATTRRAGDVVRERQAAAHRELRANDAGRRPPSGDGTAHAREADLDARARRPGRAPSRTREHGSGAGDTVRSHGARRPAACARGRTPGRRARAPGRRRLAVTNLHKVFWPKQKLTKGDLFRYYVAGRAVPPARGRRPAARDEALPERRRGPPFYQHRADDVPPGVRVETVQADAKRRPQIIGGDLKTLLYMTQLAAISQDPWFSRVASPE